MQYIVKFDVTDADGGPEGALDVMYPGNELSARELLLLPLTEFRLSHGCRGRVEVKSVRDVRNQPTLTVLVCEGCHLRLKVGQTNTLSDLCRWARKMDWADRVLGNNSAFTRDWHSYSQYFEPVPAQ